MCVVKINTNHWIITAIVGKIEVDPDAEAVATICMISTPPELRVAESKWFLSVDFSFYILLSLSLNIIMLTTSKPSDS